MRGGVKERTGCRGPKGVLKEGRVEGVEEREGEIGPKKGQEGVRGGVEVRRGCRGLKGGQKVGMSGRFRGKRR
jgi:hypothetical protein